MHLERHLHEYEQRYSRPGVVLSAGALYAPQNFSTDLAVKSSRGLWADLGYRVNPHLELGGRFDWLEGFDLSGFGYEGELDGWGASLNARLFPFTGSVQPYLGFGAGVVHADLKLDETGGSAFITDSADEAMMRFSGGLDFHVSPSLALKAEAAYQLPGGELDGLDCTTLSTGLEFRF